RRTGGGDPVRGAAATVLLFAAPCRLVSSGALGFRGRERGGGGGVAGVDAAGAADRAGGGGGAVGAGHQHAGVAFGGHGEDAREARAAETGSGLAQRGGAGAADRPLALKRVGAPA